VVDWLPIHSHFSHAEVDVGGQSSIERHFEVAVGLAGLGPAKIEELEVDGLPQLVDPVTEEEEYGDVCLDNRGRLCGRGMPRHICAAHDGRAPAASPIPTHDSQLR
jgi:hypothetical protein